MRSRSGPTPGPTRERSVCARCAGGWGIACKRSGGYFGAIRSLSLSLFLPPSLPLSHSLGRVGLWGSSHSRTANTAHAGRSKERAGHGLMDYGVPKVLYVAVLSW